MYMHHTRHSVFQWYSFANNLKKNDDRKSYHGCEQATERLLSCKVEENVSLALSVKKEMAIDRLEL